MFKTNKNKEIFNLKINEILFKYNIKLIDGIYNYTNMINNITYVTNDYTKENDIYKYCNKKYNGIECIGLFFKIIHSNLEKPIYIFKCLTCNKYYLVSIIKNIKDEKRFHSCKNCSSSVLRIKYPFILDSEREKFLKVARNMHNRCYSINSPKYHIYGARGIDIYQEWRAYENNISENEKMRRMKNFYDFAKKNGWKSNLEIDRIDNNKGYYPDNVRFVTGLENLNNRQNKREYSLNGISKSISGWSRFTKCKSQTLSNLIDNYNNLEEVYKHNKNFQKKFDIAFLNYQKYGIDLDKEKKRNFYKNKRASINNFTYRSFNMTKSNWARLINMNLSTFDYLIRKKNNDFNLALSSRLDIKEKIDKAIDSGYIYKFINSDNYKNTIKLYDILGLAAGSTTWKEVFGIDISKSLSRYKTFEDFLQKRKDLQLKMKEFLESKRILLDNDFNNKFNYNNVLFQNSNFDYNIYYKKFIDKYFSDSNQNEKTNIEIIKSLKPIIFLLLRKGFEFFISNNVNDRYIYKKDWKLTIDTFKNKDILISKDNIKYIKL